jgi:hypothetical protein
LNEWQVAGIQKAVASLDRGEGVPHERVKEWVSPSVGRINRQSRISELSNFSIGQFASLQRLKDRPESWIFCGKLCNHKNLYIPRTGQNMAAESPQRIEPARLEQPSEAITDLVAELATASATLGHALNPRTAAKLAGLVRVMNTY